MKTKDGICQFVVRAPVELIEDAGKAARTNGMSRNTYVQHAIAAALKVKIINPFYQQLKKDLLEELREELNLSSDNACI